MLADRGESAHGSEEPAIRVSAIRSDPDPKPDDCWLRQNPPVDRLLRLFQLGRLVSMRLALRFAGTFGTACSVHAPFSWGLHSSSSASFSDGWSGYGIDASEAFCFPMHGRDHQSAMQDVRDRCEMRPSLDGRDHRSAMRDAIASEQCGGSG